VKKGIADLPARPIVDAVYTPPWALTQVAVPKPVHAAKVVKAVHSAIAKVAAPIKEHYKSKGALPSRPVVASVHTPATPIVADVYTPPWALAQAKKVVAPVGGPTYSKDFKEDWHNEWKHGDFPSWKTTYPKAALKFEDRQSDGIIGNFLQVESKEEEEEEDEEEDKEEDEEEEEDAPRDEEEDKEEAKAPVGGPKYDKKAFKKDWHNEWETGHFPSWKETYPKAALKFEDRQSDGKIGNFLQKAKPEKEEAPKVTAAASPAVIKYNKKAYSKDWHNEWKDGDLPSWKETYPKAALPYEDRQSDGKIGN